MIRTAAMTNDELFEARCKRLKAASDKRRLSTWELVDELLEAEADLGERFSQAVEVTMLTPEAIDNYMRTGRAWPADKRFLNMPFDYHTALNPLEPAQRTAAMTMAQKADWDRVELRTRIAAWKAGDELAFDPRHKVAKPEKKARVSAQTPEDDSHAGVDDLNGSKDDKAVMDSGAFGEGLAAERREKLDAYRDQDLSDAHQILMRGLDTLDKALNAENRPHLPLERLSTSRLRAMAQELTRLADEADHVQSGRWSTKSKPAPKAALAEASARKDGGVLPPLTPPSTIPRTSDLSHGDCGRRTEDKGSDEAAPVRVAEGPGTAPVNSSRPAENFEPGALTAAGPDGEGDGAHTPPRTPEPVISMTSTDHARSGGLLVEGGVVLRSGLDRRSHG